jgi:hypothetical protein
MSELGFEIDLPERRAKTRNGWLGVLGACAVVWYLYGLVILVFSVQMSVETANSIYSAEQLRYVLATPIWANIFQAIALGAGLIGSVYILLRKATAYRWYMLSLIAVLAMMFDATSRSGFDIMDTTHFGVSIIGMIIGIFLFWASYNAKNKGELRTT